ncbi:MAG TPA: CHAP domain-containing protein [Acidimicrobiales bacterium]|nr:CHAP domain-containing protein [Acidimicrobiales bacterium]
MLTAGGRTSLSSPPLGKRHAVSTHRSAPSAKAVPPRVLRTTVGLVALVSVCGLAALAAPGTAAASSGTYAGTGVMAFGDAGVHGTPSGTLSSLITGMAPTPDGQGYWLVGTDGGVFSYGDATFHGSLGALRLTGPVVGMAATSDGEGYWLVALDGGVFAFGDALFHGSMGAVRLDQPVVGMAPTPDGKGYWLVAADGGIFAFGDAPFEGSMGGKALASSVVGMAPTPDGKGYWLVAGDGGIFAFGDAPFEGSKGGQSTPASVVGMAASPDGRGYWMAGNDGSVFSFGSAHGYGSTSGTKPPSPVIGMAATPDGKGYWLLEPDDWTYSFSDPPPYALPVSAAIANVAASQVGPDPDNNRGSFCNPYGPCEPWCALFATWVWRQVGIPIPSYAFTGSMFSWGGASGELLAPTAVAAPGDALLYGTGPQSTDTSVHTGIVVQVWPDGAVLTVEGDAGPAPNGQYNVVINGPFLPSNSLEYNGFPVYSIVQPVR